MRIYLAGPMRSWPDFNFPAFADATKKLRSLGHEVFSPAERDLDNGFDPAGMAGTDEDMEQSGFSLREALCADLTWITLYAEALVLLPGWRQSSGARAEVATAEAIGIPFWGLESFIDNHKEILANA